MNPMSEELRLYETLARDTFAWMDEHKTTINDAYSEALMFVETLRIHFEIAVASQIRADRDKAARMRQGEGHEHAD
jgi:hypothetical protein